MLHVSGRRSRSKEYRIKAGISLLQRVRAYEIVNECLFFYQRRDERCKIRKYNFGADKEGGINGDEMRNCLE